MLRRCRRHSAVRAGDLLMPCSDGLTGVVDDDAIERRLAGRHREPLPVICADLVEMAKANGGLDNIAVVLARVIAPG